MALGTEHVFYLSGGAANTDPSASLGGARSTVTRLHYVQSTITSAQTSLNRVVDTAQIGNPNGISAGDWLMFARGGNALQASEIQSFDSGTGTFTLRHGTTSMAASGDAYRLFKPNNLFDDATALECANGVTDYRGIYVRNEAAATITTQRLFFNVLFTGGAEWALAADDSSGVNLQTIADELTAPTLANFYGTAAGSFERALFYLASNQPLSGGANLTASSSRGLWLRRTIPPGTKAHGQAVILLVSRGVEGAAEDGAALIIADLTGYTLNLELERDRFQRIGGGGLFTVTATMAENGEPIEDQAIAWELSGVGSIFPEDDERTDANGQNALPYHSSEDPLDEGAVVTITAKGI